MFGILNHPLELFPVFNILGWSVNIKVTFTIVIPPTLGIPSDINDLWMLFPHSLYRASKIEDTYFKWLNIQNITSIDLFDNSNEFLNEWFLFIAVFDNCLFLGLKSLFDDRDSDSKRSIVWYKTPLWLDQIIIKFLWSKLKEH